MYVCCFCLMMFFFVCLFLLLFALMYILINSLLCGFHHVQTFAFFLLVFLHIVVSAAFACRPLFFLQLTFITPFLFIFLFVGEWECCFYSLICVSNLLFSFFIFLLADFDCDSFFQSNYISIMFFLCVVDVVWIVYIFIPNIALFPCVHLFFNFLLFLLSQIVKLKTKKIKPFCFRARKILSFVDVAFGVSLPFLVCTCVCVSFCFNEKFDFSAVRGELRAIAVVFFSYPAKRSWNMEKKNLFRTLKRKQKCFVFDCFYMLSETDRIARRWHNQQNRGFRINRNKREECWKMSRFY